MKVSELIIKDGRHPVIERNLPVGETYISNDLELNKTEQQIIILTGPNMSGKVCIAAPNSTDHINGTYREALFRLMKQKFR